MRERQHIAIDRKTGDVTVRTEAVEGDPGFAGRFRELWESLPGIGPVEARLAAVVCNGCGDSVTVDCDNPVQPAGWTAEADGDFCPRCQTAN